jgi:hypothetical protein
MRRTFAAALLAGLVAATAAGVALRAQDRVGVAESPAIVGVWTLDKDLSDRADQGMDRGEGGRGGGMPGGMGGGGGRGGGMPGGMGGGMPGFGGGRRDPDEAKRSNRITKDLLSPADRLTIVQDGPALLVTSGDGRAIKWLSDNREQERLTGDGAIKSRARWNGAQFTVEEKIQDGPKVTRTFIASSDTNLLILVLRMDGGDGPGQMTVHHVYTRAR